MVLDRLSKRLIAQSILSRYPAGAVMTMIELKEFSPRLVNEDGHQEISLKLDHSVGGIETKMKMHRQVVAEEIILDYYFDSPQGSFVVQWHL